MLLTEEQMKHLNIGASDYSWVFLDDDTVTDAERQWLIQFDDFWFEEVGCHAIDNYQDLYKAVPGTVVRHAVAV